MATPGEVWAFEHSVQCDAPVEFAWAFWTDVRNWGIDADVDSIEIDGPFAAGTSGRTYSKSSGRLEWRIVEAGSGRGVIEFPVPGAAGRFYWTFEESGDGTRMRQRCTLTGERAAEYVPAIGPALEAGIPAGMQKLGESIERAAGRRR